MNLCRYFRKENATVIYINIDFISFYILLKTFPCNTDSRLTEFEALEQIRQLCAQLQNLQERSPPRGAAVATISTLLENCRSSHPLTLRSTTNTTAGALTAPKLNGTSTTTTTTTTTMVIVRSDKSTNTNSTTDEMWQPISNGFTRISITDECVKSTDKSQSNGGVVAAIKNIDELNSTALTMTATSNIESNFFNLQLQCMCTCSGNDGTGVDLAEINPDESSSKKCACCIGASSSETSIDLKEPPTNRLKCSCDRDSSSSHIGTHTELSECTHCDGSLIKTYSQRPLYLGRISQQHIDRSKEGTTESYGDTVEVDTVKSREKSNDAYHRIGISFAESLGNEAPPTPSPTISNISSSVATDDRCEENRTPPSLSPVQQPVGGEVFPQMHSAEPCVASTVACISKTSTSSVITSSSAEEASSSSSSGGDTAGAIVAGSSANKRNKPDAKIVLDLNDRSKYTKEVSV